MHSFETISMRGVLALTVRRRGVIVDRWVDPNMIMTGAREALAALIAGDGPGKEITQIGVGTSGDGPSPDDEALTGAVTKAIQGHEYPEPGSVTFNWRLETTDANGMAIREFGLIAADGTLFARKTRAAIEKADDISLDGAWTIIF